MAESLITISRNISLAEIHSGELDSLNPDYALGGSMLTMILPEYSHMYSRIVQTLVTKLLIESSAPTTLPNGEPFDSFIFGVAYSDQCSFGNEPTRAFFPCVAKGFLTMIEDPTVALDNHHALIIADTNGLLQELRSPYRLEELDI